MRTIYFKRSEESPLNIHAGYYTQGVYIPDERVVLFKVRHGTFGGYTGKEFSRKFLMRQGST